MNIQMPSYVSKAMEKLTSAGYEAYAVGGCIRDYFLGKDPTDWDITTSAKPRDIMSVFSGERVIPTGIEHGTLTVLIDGHHLEITTFRIDGVYSDNRHPEVVTFTGSITDDLCRRDFTINTLAYNPVSGLVDEFSGARDIENKIIRCVGDPDKRFLEDALRIMRALRFAAVLSFEIDEDTKKSIFKNAHLLKNVSGERISTELLKMLCGENITRVLIEYRDVLAVIIPELKPAFDFSQNNKHHIYSVYDHIAYSVGYSVPEPDIRLALLLHDIGKPQCYFTDENGVGHFYGHAKVSRAISEPILSRLKLTSDMQKTVAELVLYHDCVIAPEKKVVKKRLSKFGEPLFFGLLKVKRGDSLAHNPEYQSYTEELECIERIAKEIITTGECFNLKDLQIDGTDILGLGIKSGPMVGVVLSKLLTEVIEGRTDNTSVALMNRARDIVTEEI